MQPAKRDGRLLRESVAPYARTPASSGVTKLSISLPTEVVEAVRSAAEDAGLSVSAVIAAALRRAIETAEQEKLDAAIAAQNEENLAWAQAYLPVTAKVWADLEW
jgi:hypothetical protein